MFAMSTIKISFFIWFSKGVFWPISCYFKGKIFKNQNIYRNIEFRARMKGNFTLISLHVSEVFLK